MERVGARSGRMERSRFRREGMRSGRRCCARREREGAIDAVALNYLTKNVAPVVDEIVVQPGARMQCEWRASECATVQVAFPQAAGALAVVAFPPDASTSPLTAQKDRTAVTARWLAHDDNGDDLMFAVWYRGVGEKNWRLLKEKIRERLRASIASLLPDGQYEMKVVASDAPVHTDAEALTGERVGTVFVVDTTPPVPGVLTATMVAGNDRVIARPHKIHATLEVHDATSPIAHAEYSVDAGPWQYLEPVGRVSDSLTERYDFSGGARRRRLP